MARGTRLALTATKCNWPSTATCFFFLFYKYNLRRNKKIYCGTFFLVDPLAYVTKLRLGYIHLASYERCY